MPLLPRIHFSKPACAASALLPVPSSVTYSVCSLAKNSAKGVEALPPLVPSARDARAESVGKPLRMAIACCAALARVGAAHRRAEGPLVGCRYELPPATAQR